MSSESWIEILNRAIQLSADWEVEDDESGQNFIYDSEVLNDIVTLLETGATSDEVVHQYGEYVGSDFERYVEVLEQAMEQAEDEEPDVLDDNPPVVQETLDSEQLDQQGESFELPEEEAGAASEASTNKPQKSKKGLVVGSAVAGLVLMLGAGGFVFYSAFTQTSAPAAQSRNVTTVLKSTPKPPVNEQGPRQPETTANPDGVDTGRQQSSPANENKGFTVAQIGSEQNQNVISQSRAQNPTPTAVQQSGTPTQSSRPAQNVALDDSQIDEMRNEINAQIEKIEESMTAKIGDRFGDLRETLGRLEAQLKRIDELEQKIAEEKSEEDVRSELVKQKVKGLTRLGEFSILANAGVNNRVVALSPTNKVITLEEGERNILAAGSNLTVEEIIGNGDAVIFSNGWFIDHVRAPESLREQRLSQEAAESDTRSEGTDNKPQVPRTAAISKSLNPATVAASSRNRSTVDSRFPTIQRAPQGWEASALIPPRRAVIITPEGNSITITPGSEIAGLGKVHSVKQDRVLAGQYFIPLSNM
ncbi:hypothetical protein [Marinobacter sp.]|uniref:hypothetical protein n=1 Tax=Marinobacter sp. TaxID=50741 RepID=UPI0035615935